MRSGDLLDLTSTILIDKQYPLPKYFLASYVARARGTSSSAMLAIRRIRMLPPPPRKDSDSIACSRRHEIYGNGFV